MLGAKNAVLREQLGRLEDRVRVLQVAAGAAPAAATPPMAGQKQAPRPKKKKPEPEPKPEEGAGAPWLLAGAAAGVLALLAGLVFALRRRKAARHAAGAGEGAMARLKARLEAALRRKAAPAAALEPSLGGGAHESSTQV
jgi:pilus assembly protein FimV